MFSRDVDGTYRSDDLLGSWPFSLSAAIGEQRQAHRHEARWLAVEADDVVVLLRLVPGIDDHSRWGVERSSGGESLVGEVR